MTRRKGKPPLFKSAEGVAIATGRTVSELELITERIEQDIDIFLDKLKKITAVLVLSDLGLHTNKSITFTA